MPSPHVRRPRLLLALALATVLAPACALLPEGDGEDLGAERAALARAREQWERQEPSGYQFVLQRRCMVCNPGPVTITVQDGVMQSAVLDDGLPAPAEYVEGYGTVEALFARIEASIQGGADRLDARYEEGFGYPVEVDVDPIRNAIDDEHGFAVAAMLLPLES